MSIIGFHASHEQIDPASLLKFVVQAEQAGFDAAMCSDHFAPWSERQGQSGFAWAWLGAALQATSLPFGVVNARGQRYHPAIIAQASATLEQMFPGRFWMALGSAKLPMSISPVSAGQTSRHAMNGSGNASRSCAVCLPGKWLRIGGT